MGQIVAYWFAEFLAGGFEIENIVYDLKRHPDVDRSRVLMVGDTVHTDVLGGLASGIKTLLVHQGGFLDGQDIEGVFARSGLRPHFCARAIGHGIEDDAEAVAV